MSVETQKPSALLGGGLLLILGLKVAYDGDILRLYQLDKPEFVEGRNQ